MDVSLQGRTALVTGGSKGIGKAIASRLAQAGCDVAIVARDSQVLAATAAEIGSVTGRRVVGLGVDLSAAEAGDECVGRFGQSFDRLDILVNNAGATRRGDFVDLDEDDWQSGFALKFHGYVRMCRAAWPLLKQSAGKVVNVVGVGARTPEADFSIGSSVNAGLLALTKSLAATGLRDGIRVNAVNPGPVETARLQKLVSDLSDRNGCSREEALQIILGSLSAPRIGLPDDIASLVLFLVSDCAGYIHGSLIDVDGGATRGL